MVRAGCGCLILALALLLIGFILLWIVPLPF